MPNIQSINTLDVGSRGRLWSLGKGQHQAYFFMPLTKSKHCLGCLKKIWSNYKYCLECWKKFGKSKWTGQYVENKKLSLYQFEKRYHIKKQFPKVGNKGKDLKK